MTHFADKELTDYPWKVFQYGHYGWFFTNGNSVIHHQSFSTKELAEFHMEDMKRKELAL